MGVKIEGQKSQKTLIFIQYIPRSKDGTSNGCRIYSESYKKKRFNELILYLVPEAILMKYLGIGRNGCIKSHVSVSQLEKSYRTSSEIEHFFAKQKGSIISFE